MKTNLSLFADYALTNTIFHRAFAGVSFDPIPLDLRFPENRVEARKRRLRQMTEIITQNLGRLK